MAKPVLASEAHRIRRLGRSWTAMAGAAEGHGGVLARAAAKGSVTTRSESSGERLRAYVTDLGVAAATMAAAYSRAAAHAPRAATATEAAKVAQQVLEQATRGLAKAGAALSAAETAVVSANVTVATHRAAGAISILIGVNIGPSPAQFAALEHAELRLVQAVHHHEAAQWVLGNGEQAVVQAEQERHRATRAFAAACRAEAQVARRALPEAPQPPVVPAQIGVLADGLAALASVAAGQALAIGRFARGAADTADGALEMIDRWAKRPARFGRAGEFVAP